MARWDEVAVESAFKPVPGGYIARLPVRNFLGGTRSYVVNEAQKQEIVAVLRRQRIMMICAAAIFPILGAAIGLGAGIWGLTSDQAVAAIAALLVVLVPAMMVAMVGYVRRRLRPLVGTLQPPDQTVSFREQVETVARRISAPVVVVGLISGTGMVIISIMVAMNTAQAQRHLGVLPSYFFCFAARGTGRNAPAA